MRVLVALIAGAVSVFAYAPFGIFALMLLSLGALAWLLARTERIGTGFLFGFGWGFGAFMAGVSWLYIALHRYGGLPMPLSAVAIMLFSAYLALYPGMAAALTVYLRPRGALAQGGIFAAAWLLGEWLRGVVFTGFPWLASGYTQTPPSPLSGYLPVLGVYGTGGIVALTAGILVFANWKRRRSATAAVACACALVAGGYGLARVAWTTPRDESITVALIQTNIAQDLKWNSARLYDWLQVNADMVRSYPAQLTVLPETTLPLLVDDLPEGYLQALAQTAREAGGDVVVGAFLRDGEGKVYNGALSLGASGQQTYHKRHLVPFGEYSPPLFGWFFRMMNMPMSDQYPGDRKQSPMMLGTQRIAINICYEDLFGAELLDSLPEATLMLNLSNLAWYGHSWAQPQHLQIARVRALETGRPMLRSTNTGMTAIIRPDGTVLDVLPEFQRGALHAEVRGFDGSTPFARWGNRPALILAIGMLSLAFGRKMLFRFHG